MIELIIYIFILLMGVASIALEEQTDGKQNRSPIELIFSVHLGFIELIIIAVYYIFTGKYFN